MSQKKYVQKLQQLSKLNVFKKDIEKIRSDFQVYFTFGKIKNNFGIISRWNRQQLKKWQSTGFYLFERTDLLMKKYGFPLIFRSDFINFVFYGLAAVEEAERLDGETPKVILERNFKTSPPQLFLRIFGDTTWREIASIWEMVTIAQKGKDIFKSPLPERKYIREGDEKDFSNFIIYIPQATNQLPELRIQIYGDTTYRDLREIWKKTKYLQKKLPENKNYHILSEQNLNERLSILKTIKHKVKSKNVESYNQVIDVDQTKKSLPVAEQQKLVRRARQKKYILKKKFMI